MFESNIQKSQTIQEAHYIAQNTKVLNSSGSGFLETLSAVSLDGHLVSYENSVNQDDRFENVIVPENDPATSETNDLNDIAKSKDRSALLKLFKNLSLESDKEMPLKNSERNILDSEQKNNSPYDTQLFSFLIPVADTIRKGRVFVNIANKNSNTLDGHGKLSKENKSNRTLDIVNQKLKSSFNKSAAKIDSQMMGNTTINKAKTHEQLSNLQQLNKYNTLTGKNLLVPQETSGTKKKSSTLSQQQDLSQINGTDSLSTPIAVKNMSERIGFQRALENLESAKITDQNKLIDNLVQKTKHGEKQDSNVITSQQELQNRPDIGRLQSSIDSSKQDNFTGPFKDKISIETSSFKRGNGKFEQSFSGQQNFDQKAKNNSVPFLINNVDNALILESTGEKGIRPKLKNTVLQSQSLSDLFKTNSTKIGLTGKSVPHITNLRETFNKVFKSFEQQNENSLRVKIDVENLGKLNISLNKRVDDISILIQTGSLKSKEIIDKLIPQLMVSLQAQQNTNIEMNVTYQDSRDGSFDNNRFWDREKGQHSKEKSRQIKGPMNNETEGPARRRYSWSSYEVVA